MSVFGYLVIEVASQSISMAVAFSQKQEESCEQNN